ncbi:MAG: YceI family protein [Gammaproteobacteria bacterium]|nr:YceI family protein [Gammaproteobacteria bacterium]MCY4356378.1 YceI family protein [Gammaproteobacteria bacterium]
MRNTFGFAALLSSAILILPGLASAQWSLNNEESTLSFTTVKADHLAEVHTFDMLSGAIGDDGAVAISIELASVNTLIPIRNERMQAMLFETELFPEATIEADIDLESLVEMEAGQSESMQLNFNLSLHGETRPYTAEVRVTRLAEGLVASTLKPILVTAEDFELQDGVEALRDVAGLPSISRAVPVNFSVQFDQGE